MSNTSAFEEGLGHDCSGSIFWVEELGVHLNKFINCDFNYKYTLFVVKTNWRHLGSISHLIIMAAVSFYINLKLGKSQYYLG